MNTRQTIHRASADDNPIPYECRLSTYDYELPERLIAQEPEAPRDESRLLALNRQTGRVSHRSFRELPSLLKPSDVLVLNETKVIPAALRARKPTGGRVDLLVLDPAGVARGIDLSALAERICMFHSSKPLRSGAALKLEDGREIIVGESVAPGRVRVRFPAQEADFLAFLEEWGHPPLPPYIRDPARDSERDRKRYQTVYARQAGSVAAPTAGLHFTDGLLRELEAGGVRIARIVLHVGPGTFTPVKHEDIRMHRMEAEYYETPELAAELINRAFAEKARIIAVGTTSVRTLESAIDPNGRLIAGKGRTDLFIRPAYGFRTIRGLITNFHLPKSTLLMLVCAFAGVESVMAAYHEAVALKYRFFSYGDACLIVD
ncbi:MAG: tRNA preQ1(34) S-adenosylmethionine ribosyltransferase-isomerase QueA [Deltaproteobacteria bacterium]|nr:tRNA preQ1(34) S-adenosylmethionine ribosyltransferase-isomerase QueA [Deltaproteobacteria bacterium]